MSRVTATFVFPIIRDDFIVPALQTLRVTKPVGIEFRTVVIDQNRRGVYDKISDYVDLYLRPQRNMGFAKAMNEGIIHGLHWGSEYVVAANDDVEFLDSRWWQGILDQFKEYPEMMAVNPASVIEPGWGYGIDQPNFKCPDWGIANMDNKNIYPKKKDGTAFNYDDAKTKEGYDWLLNNYKKGHIEGFAGWMVVGKREMWENVGLYDERFVPGGGEDYDLCHRIYLAGGRASATMRSWVWHHWGQSKAVAHDPIRLPINRPTFQSVDSLYVHSPEGATSPIYPPRENEPHNNKRKRKNPGIFVDDIR